LHRLWLRRSSIIAGAWVLALFLLAPGMSSPFDKEMEARSCTWIEDVARNGHWLLPLDIYQRPSLKPPLFYWLGAIVVELAGGRIDEPRCRVVSLVSAATLATATMVWTADRIGAFEGWLAFFILISTYAFSARATSTLMDMLFSLLMLTAYYVVYPLMSGAVSRRRTLAGGLLLGFAILTKGPLALALCALATVIYFLMSEGPSLRLLPERLCLWQVAAIACGVAAGWYLPALMIWQDRLARIMMHENAGHFLPASMGGTGEAARPIYYILLRVGGGSLPWCLLILPAIIGLTNGAIRKEARPAVLYQLAMMLAVVLFFSIGSAKRDEYILPAMPALSIVASAAFAIDPDVSRARWPLRTRRMVLGGAAVFIAAFVAVSFAAARSGIFSTMLHLNLQSSDRGYERLFADGMARVQEPFLLLIGATLVGFIIVTAGLWRAVDEWTVCGLAIMVTAGVLIFNGVLRPRLAQARSPIRFAAAVRARIGDAPLYLVQGEDVPFSLYYGRGVPSLPRKFPGGGFLVARARELAVLLPSERMRLRCLMRSDLIGGDGTPALYGIEPPLGSGGFSPLRYEPGSSENNNAQCSSTERSN
jgi:4-amino-4-deoxy-L-arabinose transferase-like glycosyltransferase